MRRRACLLAALAALLARQLAARGDEPADGDVEVDRADASRLHVELRVRIGAAVAPFHTAALSEVESEFTQARLLVVTGRYRIGPRLALGARLPVAASTVMLPAGSYADDKALGNPELFLEDDRAHGPVLRGTLRARAALRLGIGLPFAEHGAPPSLLEHRALALADALDGWRNPELFTAGVVPLTLSGRLTLSRARFRVGAGAKLPLAIRLHDAGLPDDARTRPVGFTPHVHLSGTWLPRSWLAVEAAAFAAARVPAPVAPPGRRDAALQLGVEPRVVVGLGPLSLAAELMVALGGPLDGTIGIGLALAYQCCVATQ